MSDWIDISVPLSARTVRWPGDRPFEAARDCAIERGDGCNLTSFAMSAHFGTHVDAPLHYIGMGASVDELCWDALIGRARVIAVAGEVVAHADIERLAPAPGERLLLKTRNSERLRYDEPFSEQYVHLSSEAARKLAQRRPALVGIDYLSIGAPGEQGAITHTVLLGAGVWIVESLDLRGVAPGDYELVCLPLRLAGFEGSPARVILKAIEC